MELFKEILSDLKITFKNWLYANVILLLPTIGMLLSVEFDAIWIFVVCVCVGYIVLEFYGCRYHKINNKKDETKLEIHHYVDDNYIEVKSTETIDKLIDIKIVKYTKINDKK